MVTFIINNYINVKQLQTVTSDILKYVFSPFRQIITGFKTVLGLIPQPFNAGALCIRSRLREGLDV